MADPGVRVECDGPVATVTLCRPHVLNAQTPAMWGELRTIGRDLPGDIRVVVVRGEGRAFSAGLDLAAVSAPAEADGAENFSFARMAGMTDDEATSRIAGFQAGFAWLRRPDMVSIAAVRGHAIGAGFQLALACDLRVCTEDAQFTMAEVAWAWCPTWAGPSGSSSWSGTPGRWRSASPAAGSAPPRQSGSAWPPRSSRRRPRPGRSDLTAQILAARRDAVVEIKALLAGAAGRSFAEQESAEREAQVRRIRDIVGQGE